MAMSMKRIRREILDLTKEEMGDLTLVPSERSIYDWAATIPGPSGSPYAGGTFNLQITLPQDYPFSAPKVVFTTPVYHPNVSPQGHICVDVLKNQWSPALSLYKVMLSISSLLTDPNPNDPLVPAIAQEYLKKRSVFDQKAREWTVKHAMPKQKNVAAKQKSATASTSGSIPTTAADDQQPTGLLASLLNFATGRSPIPTPPLNSVPSETSRRSARNTRQATSSGTQAASRPPAPTSNGATSRNMDIIILDDDDDDEMPAPSTSAAPASAASTVSRAGRKRKRDAGEADAGNGNGEGSTRQRRRNPRMMNEAVIVIDDD